MDVYKNNVLLFTANLSRFTETDILINTSNNWNSYKTNLLNKYLKKSKAINTINLSSPLTINTTNGADTIINVNEK
jgi:hypothetical protein